jgi:hypothetical protein
MTIATALTKAFFLFRSMGRPHYYNRRAKSFRSCHQASRFIVCEAVRVHGHVLHIDKCCPLTQVHS